MGSWCHYCANHKLCDRDDCAYCYNKSFASHEKAKYWSSNNDVTPRQVFKSSSSKYYFDCNVCNRTFPSSPARISCGGSWCPNCVNKTEAKLFDIMLLSYPNLVRQFKAEWCKSKKFDFCIPDLKIIIELDGDQHFKQVSNWIPHEETQSNDLYKERCATENDYQVIRLLQTDVWNDTYDWKTKLVNTIEEIRTNTDTLEVVFMSQNDEYAPYMECHA